MLWTSLSEPLPRQKFLVKLNFQMVVSILGGEICRLLSHLPLFISLIIIFGKWRKLNKLINKLKKKMEIESNRHFFLFGCWLFFARPTGHSTPICHSSLRTDEEEQEEEEELLLSSQLQVLPGKFSDSRSLLALTIELLTLVKIDRWLRNHCLMGLHVALMG